MCRPLQIQPPEPLKPVEAADAHPVADPNDLRVEVGPADPHIHSDLPAEEPPVERYFEGGWQQGDHQQGQRSYHSVCFWIKHVGRWCPARQMVNASSGERRPELPQTAKC